MKERGVDHLAQRVVASASLGVAIADAAVPDLPLVYVNPEFERITGYRFDEVVGRNCRFLQGPDTSPRAVARLRAALREQVPIELTILNYRKDGRPFWNQLRLTPVVEADRNRAYVIGYLADRGLPPRHAGMEGGAASERPSRLSFLGTCNLDGILTEASRGSLQPYGLSSTDAVGLAIWQLPVWNQDPEIEAFLKFAVKRATGGTPTHDDVRITDASGDTLWTEVRINPGFDDQGDVTHMVASIVDVTDRVESHRLRDRMGEILDRTPDGVVSTDTTGKILYTNPAAVKLLRASEEGLQGRSIVEFMDPRTRTRFEETILPATARDGRWEGEGTLQVGGVSIPASLAFISHTEDGSVHSLSALIRDRSEPIRIRQRLLAELRVAQILDAASSLEEAMSAILEALIETLGFAIAEYYSIDAETGDAHLAFADHDRTIATEGISRFSFLRIGQRFRLGQGVPGVALNADGPTWLEVTRDERVVRSEEARAIGLVSALAFPAGAPGDRVGIFVLFDRSAIPADRHWQAAAEAVSRNIGEFVQHVRTETGLRMAQKAAEEASEAKTRFLASMSHELRTPMAAILGYTELLATRVDPSSRRMLEVIQRNGEDMVAMLNDILDLAKVEEGRVDLVLEPLSPVRLVRDLGSLMEPRARSKSLAFEITYTGEIPLSLRSDVVRIRQILTNLLTNAIKFTSTGSVRLQVDGRPRDPEPTLSFDVVDTGIGIPEERLDSIFEPFEQLQATVDGRSGTGLGLTISRRLARALGGDVTVESTVGAGSRFRLALPIAAGDAEHVVSAEDVEQVAHDPRLAGDGNARQRLHGRVLVVDDHGDMRRLLAHYLEGAGASVTTARDGEEAVAAVAEALRAEDPFRGIVMDMQMPRMDGYKAARTIRTSLPETPIVAVSAGAMKEDQRKALDAGCNTFLAKPITGTRLVSALSDLMEAGSRNVDLEEPRGHRVLLVEDDEDLADVTARILRQWGHEVSVAHRGDTALEAAIRLQPTLVLMDQNLPDQDGLTLTGALLDSLARAPEIVALTGTQDTDALERMNQAGFAAILIKPAKLDDLRQVLRDAAVWESGS